MGKFFSDKVEEGIRLVWLQFDKEEIRRGMQLLDQAAQEGDADAYCFLARCYMGHQYVWGSAGLPEDAEIAANYIKESVLRGSAAGILCAMRCGELTPSIRKNMPLTLSQARDIILEKAKLGEPFCQYMIGNTYFWGDVIEIDQLDCQNEYPTEASYNAYAYPIAIEWFERSLKGGMTKAAGNLYNVFLGKDTGFSGDIQQAKSYQRMAAEMGDPGMMSNYGNQIAEDGQKEEGFRWQKASADVGDSLGCYNTGWNYWNGQGVEKDRTNGFIYFMKAAEMGDTDAYFYVGNAYYWGSGIEEDNAKAVYWLQKSAEAGDFWGYPMLAACYQHGWGTQCDYDYSFYLFNQALEKIDDYSDYIRGIVWDGLGEAYGYGYGTEEDIPRAVEYYKKAIKAGFEPAEEDIKHFKKNFFGRWKRVDWYRFDE